jgi:sugar lactone lactonase YvrE
MHAEGSKLHGLGFPESLRWRADGIWFSDMFRSRVVRWRPGGGVDVVLDRDSGGPAMPGGLGWLPDGDLLVVDCLERRVLRVRGEGAGAAVTVHAELRELFDAPANDMHVDPDGTAWVGGYGFDPEREAPRASRLAVVQPGGRVSASEAEFVFPNGCERGPDGALVVAETFADRVTGVAGTGGGSTLAALPTGSGPDGLSIAADGTVFVALAFAGTVVALDDDGTHRVIHRAEPVRSGDAAGPRGCYDCAVSPDGRSIAIAMASQDEPLAMRVDSGSVEIVRLL